MNRGAAAPLPDSLDTLANSLTRERLFALAGILCVLNARFSAMLEAWVREGVFGSGSQLLGVAAILWFALYALWVLGAEARAPGAPSRGDWAMLLAMAAGAVLPVQVAASAAGLLGGLWLWRTSPPGSDARRIAVILLAIAGNLVVAPLVLAVAAKPILQLDGAFVAWLSGTAVQDNLVDFAGRGRFMIGTGCSSFHNMSLGVLLWVTLIQLFRLRIDARLGAYLALVLGGLFLVNGARLAAIALHPQAFVLYHEGWIAVAFGWVSLVVVAGLSGLAVIDAARRQG